MIHSLPVKYQSHNICIRGHVNISNFVAQSRHKTNIDKDEIQIVSKCLTRERVNTYISETSGSIVWKFLSLFFTICQT